MCRVKPQGRGIPKISDPWDRRPRAGYFGNAIAWTALAGVKTAAGRYHSFLEIKIVCFIEFLIIPAGYPSNRFFWKKTRLAPKNRKWVFSAEELLQLVMCPPTTLEIPARFLGGVALQSNSMIYRVQLSHLSWHHSSLKTPALASTKDIGWKFILISYPMYLPGNSALSVSCSLPVNHIR